MGCGYPGLRLAPLLRQHPAPGDHLQGPGALTLTSRVQVPSLLLLGAGLGLLLAPAPASQMVAAVSRHCGISGRQQQLVAELVTTTVVRELGEQLGCSCNAAGVYTAMCVQARWWRRPRRAWRCPRCWGTPGPPDPASSASAW